METPREVFCEVVCWRFALRSRCRRFATSLRGGLALARTPFGACGLRPTAAPFPAPPFRRGGGPRFRSSCDACRPWRPVRAGSRRWTLPPRPPIASPNPKTEPESGAPSKAVCGASSKPFEGRRIWEIWPWPEYGEGRRQREGAGWDNQNKNATADMGYGQHGGRRRWLDRCCDPLRRQEGSRIVRTQPKGAGASIRSIARTEAHGVGTGLVRGPIGCCCPKCGTRRTASAGQDPAGLRLGRLRVDMCCRGYGQLSPVGAGNRLCDAVRGRDRAYTVRLGRGGEAASPADRLLPCNNASDSSGSRPMVDLHQEAGATDRAHAGSLFRSA